MLPTIKKTSHTVILLLDSVLIEHASKMDTSEEKIRHNLHVFLDKGKNANQADESVHSVYDPDTIVVNDEHFLFLRFKGNRNKENREVGPQCRPYFDYESLLNQLQQNRYVYESGG